MAILHNDLTNQYKKNAYQLPVSFLCYFFVIFIIILSFLCPLRGPPTTLEHHPPVVRGHPCFETRWLSP